MRLRLDPRIASAHATGWVGGVGPDGAGKTTLLERIGGCPALDCA